MNFVSLRLNSGMMQRVRVWLHLERPWLMYINIHKDGPMNTQMISRVLLSVGPKQVFESHTVKHLVKDHTRAHNASGILTCSVSVARYADAQAEVKGDLAGEFHVSKGTENKIGTTGSMDSFNQSSTAEEYVNKYL